jgi:hypothetical protein
MLLKTANPTTIKIREKNTSIIILMLKKETAYTRPSKTHTICPNNLHPLRKIQHNIIALATKTTGTTIPILHVSPRNRQHRVLNKSSTTGL